MADPTQPVEVDRIRRAPFVRDVEWHAVVRSTNDRGILAAADAGVATPLLILAGTQTAGRGRGANRWWSGPGALTFSLVFDPLADIAAHTGTPLETEHWPRVALSAGVALCDVLQQFAGQIDCEIKWPNDVLLAGRKLAGILVEIPPGSAAASRRLVLGMGVNVNNSLAALPTEVQTSATSLCDVLGRQLDVTQLLIDWLACFAARLDHLASADPALPARWRSLCALAGKRIELKSGNRTVRGLCRGIDLDGALLVETGAGPERLYAGTLVRVVEEPTNTSPS